MKKLILLTIVFILTSVPAKAALNPDKILNIPPEVQQFLDTQTHTEFGRYFLMRIKKAVTGDALSQLIVGGVFLASRKLPKHLERAYMWAYLAKQGGIPEASNYSSNIWECCFIGDSSSDITDK